VGVAIPGHFILRLQSPTFTIFVDPFNGGNFLTPATPRRILMRICSNLHQIYQKEKHLGERDRLQKYLIHLAN
ncbi:MAG: transglutaminase family protein, partial [Verrucomicrobiota bacterium]|nr:transglutaminase family protein [Verrucomicrobiota bacterium]